jgi:class 3 adenylate cyclase/TolB-like protein/tetratricopeptide (TPR) repeat protein
MASDDISPVQRRLAAILAGDVVGFSRLMGSDEAGTLQKVRTLRHGIVEPVLARFGGRLFKWMGDGFLAEFQSPVVAVEAALAIQAEISTSGSDLALRIGINLGDVIAESDGDVYGDGVNIAARLEGLCEPGAVLLSGKVYDEVRTKLALNAVDLGARSLKNISAPVRLVSIVPGSSYPSGRARLQHLLKRRWRALVACALLASGLGAAVVGHALPWHWRAAETSSPSLGVLPVVAASRELDHAAADLTERISSKLGRDRALRVIALNPPVGQSADAAGRDTKSGYVLAGTLREGDGGPRLSLRLLETGAGGQVWADVSPASTAGEEPDKIATWAASAIAGWTGAIALAEFQRSQGLAPEDLSPYQCTVQAYQSTINQTSDLSARRARSCLEALLARNANQAELWAMLSQILALQRWWGTGLEGKTTVAERASLVPKAMLAASKAVELSPDDPVGHFALTRAYNLACLGGQVRAEALRTVALSGNDPTIKGAMGNALAYTGSWDLGIPMIEEAARVLGPKTPRWWWWAIAKDHWRKGEYDAAVDAFLQSYNEQNWISHLQMAYALPPTGRVAEAKAHVEKLRRLYPEITIKAADEYYGMFCLDDGFRHKMGEQLRIAGLPEQ